MKLALSFVFLVGFFALGCQAGSLIGGESSVTDSDKENVETAKKMVEKTVREDYRKEEGYRTTIGFSDWDIKRQVVSGVLYNMKWKTTYIFKCITTDCKERAPRVEHWAAKVWFKLGEDQGHQYAEGAEPACVDCELLTSTLTSGHQPPTSNH